MTADLFYFLLFTVNYIIIGSQCVEALQDFTAKVHEKGSCRHVFSVMTFQIPNPYDTFFRET